jgi:hypothetical protein
VKKERENVEHILKALLTPISPRGFSFEQLGGFGSPLWKALHPARNDAALPAGAMDPHPICMGHINAKKLYRDCPEKASVLLCTLVPNKELWAQVSRDALASEFISEAWELSGGTSAVDGGASMLSTLSKGACWIQAGFPPNKSGLSRFQDILFWLVDPQFDEADEPRMNIDTSYWRRRLHNGPKGFSVRMMFTLLMVFHKTLDRLPNFAPRMVAVVLNARGLARKMWSLLRPRPGPWGSDPSHSEFLKNAEAAAEFRSAFFPDADSDVEYDSEDELAYVELMRHVTDESEQKIRSVLDWICGEAKRVNALKRGEERRGFELRQWEFADEESEETSVARMMGIMTRMGPIFRGFDSSGSTPKPELTA